MATFARVWNMKQEKDRTAVSVVFIKKDRKNTVIAVFTGEYSHEEQKDAVLEVNE